MSAKSIEKIKSVMNSHLCNRCGSCVGLSQGKIMFKDKTGDYRPHILNKLEESESYRIWQACSGKEFDFTTYRKHFYPDIPHFHTYIGPYHNIYIGHAKDAEIRRNGASGGIISAILIYLLQKGMIGGAVTLRMSRKEPWLCEPFIATTKEEILEAAQSKYTISSVNEILPQIEKFGGKLAYVGLPGQIQSIRKLQAANNPVVINIKYIFGPFYGNSLHFSSVTSLLSSYKEKDYTKINKLYFRHGEWPGSMRVEMENGRVIELKKFHANYLIPFNILRNSLYCTDFTNEFTDISGGDAWAPVYEHRGKGFSIVIARSKEGKQILDEMIKDRWLELNPITEEKAISMHSHGYDFKKRGAFIRIKFRKWLGKSVPDYGYQINGFPLKRYIMEFFISSLFVVLGTRISRWLVEQLPAATIGKLFEKARTSWKKSTHKIKQNNL